MATNRMSIYRGEPIAALLERTGAAAGGSTSISGAINAAVARYQEMTRQARPTLSSAEWNCLADLLNGTVTDDGLWARKPAGCLAMELEDGLRDGLAEKWQIDGPALLEKIRSWDHATGVSCLEAIEILTFVNRPEHLQKMGRISPVTFEELFTEAAQ